MSVGCQVTRKQRHFGDVVADRPPDIKRMWRNQGGHWNLGSYSTSGFASDGGDLAAARLKFQRCASGRAAPASKRWCICASFARLGPTPAPDDELFRRSDHSLLACEQLMNNSRPNMVSPGSPRPAVIAP